MPALYFLSFPLPPQSSCARSSSQSAKTRSPYGRIGLKQVSRIRSELREQAGGETRREVNSVNNNEIGMKMMEESKNDVGSTQMMER